MNANAPLKNSPQNEPRNSPRTTAEHGKRKSGSRLMALARAEWLQFRRNKVIMFMAVAIPLGVPLLVLAQVASADNQQKMNTSGAIAMEIFLALSSLLVLYYSVLSMATTRRDESVLKRLRTGEARDWEILTAIAVPGSVILAVMFVVFCVVLVTIGVDMPVNPVALVVTLVASLVLSTLMALVTSAFTKNAEAAQITSMPVIILGMLSFATNRQMLPDALQPLLEKNPFGLLYDMVYLGWNGNYPSAVLEGASALPTGELFQETAISSGLLLLWAFILVWSVREYMLWDTHR